MLWCKEGGIHVSDCITELEAWLRRHADREKAEAMEAYMRNQFPFLGIKKPEREKLLKEFWKRYGLPKGEELLHAAERLWELPEREFHYAAMGLMEKYGKTAERSHIDRLERWVTPQSWWDTVDFIADHLIGGHFKRYPDLIPAYTGRWIESDNMWLRRTALLFQLKYKDKTDAARLFDFIDRTKDESEFFIRKAIGWALREYAKTDAAAVLRYAEATELSPLSRKEALKHLS